jgi:hypothetical protein
VEIDCDIATLEAGCATFHEVTNHKPLVLCPISPN